MTGQCQIFAPTVYFDCLFTSTVCANGWSQLVAFTVQSSQLTTVCTCFVPFSRTFSCFVPFFDTGREKGSSPEVRPAEITRLIRHGHRSGMAKDPAWPKIRHGQRSGMAKDPAQAKRQTAGQQAGGLSRFHHEIPCRDIRRAGRLTGRRAGPTFSNQSSR